MTDGTYSCIKFQINHCDILMNHNNNHKQLHKNTFPFCINLVYASFLYRVFEVGPHRDFLCLARFIDPLLHNLQPEDISVACHNVLKVTSSHFYNVMHERKSAFVPVYNME